VAEELGWTPTGEVISLTPIVQKGGKVVQSWAMRADWDPAALHSNTFELEWPRGSGRMQRFPEVDRAAWFPLAEARKRILPSQLPLLAELVQLLA
jgi:predicted NUDIX family NTP pyrophosphohydrolase